MWGCLAKEQRVCVRVPVRSYTAPRTGTVNLSCAKKQYGAQRSKVIKHGAQRPKVIKHGAHSAQRSKVIKHGAPRSKVIVVLSKENVEIDVSVYILICVLDFENVGTCT